MSNKSSEEGVPSRATTRIGLLIGVPLAVVLGVHAVSWAAATLKTWTSGETLRAADLNANFAAVNSAFVDLTSNQSIAGDKTFTGSVSATTLAGNGASITNLNGANLQAGSVPVSALNASGLSHTHALSTVLGTLQTKVISSGQYDSICASCDRGGVLTGGVCQNDGVSGLRMGATYSDGVSYCCNAENSAATGFDYTIRAQAICVSIGGPTFP